MSDHPEFRVVPTARNAGPRLSWYDRPRGRAARQGIAPDLLWQQRDALPCPTPFASGGRSWDASAMHERNTDGRGREQALASTGGLRRVSDRTTAIIGPVDIPGK